MAAKAMAYSFIGYATATIDFVSIIRTERFASQSTIEGSSDSRLSSNDWKDKDPYEANTLHNSQSWLQLLELFVLRQLMVVFSFKDYNGFIFGQSMSFECLHRACHISLCRSIEYHFGKKSNLARFDSFRALNIIRCLLIKKHSWLT